MRLSSRVLLAMLATAVLAIALSASASGSRLQFTRSERGFRIVWPELEFANSEFTIFIRCPVTLEGTISSATFPKTRGTLIARVSSAAMGTCTGGRGRFLTETLPWEVKYAGFEGPLPTIVAMNVDLVGMSFLLEAFGLMSCLYRTTATNPGIGISTVEGGAIRRFSLEIREPMVGTPIGCPGARIAERNGTATVMGETAGVILRLI